MESASLTEKTMGRTRRAPLPEYVAGGKGRPWYTSHTYPTKVPPETIVPFIEASTHVGGIVADPFCGSGMTGVAALLAGRQAVLSDLSPGAVHLARNHTRRVPPEQLSEAITLMDSTWMKRYERDLYDSSINTDHGVAYGIARHTVWSEVYRCDCCQLPVVLWDVIEPDAPIPRLIRCSSCNTSFDRTTSRSICSAPIQIAISPHDGGHLVYGTPTGDAIAKIDSIQQRRRRHWIPRTPISSDREMYIRSALHLRRIRTVADMFAKRPALALSRLRHAISLVPQAPVREALEFAFTNTAWHSSKMRRYNAGGGHRPLTGTLFIPQLVSEPNVFEVFRNQIRQVVRLYNAIPEGNVHVRMSSATDLSWLPDHSVDYVFTDPPFGNNIHYADCNIVWESWIGHITDLNSEIVVNKSRKPENGGKTVGDYQRLLTASFRECARIVAPEGRVSIVFHNADDAVWSALLAATEDSGLHHEDVAILDKGQRSQKGYKIRQGELVPFYDLIMTFSLSRRPQDQLNGAVGSSLHALNRHLTSLGPRDTPKKRTLEYLYSVAIGGLLRSGTKPTGLSFRAFRTLCENNFKRIGDSYYAPKT